MDTTAHFLLSAHVRLDAYRTTLEVRIDDGSRPWVMTHPASQYHREEESETARYLALRYLVSRPDQIKHTSVTAVTALLQTALQAQEGQR